ncbi:MAG: DUF4846 domain-containing protein [Clostridiales bacterium]|jgi:hypothetical protein|nr:DUF4846 domain-containing protein [Clostridiales bacterium]
MKKKIIFIVVVLLIAIFAVALYVHIKNNRNNDSDVPVLINAEGLTVDSRFLPPENCVKVNPEEGSFAGFLVNRPLKIYGEPALLYNGQINKDASEVGVFTYDLTNSDLEQCADSLIRLRAEYLYSKDEYDKISFKFVSGFECDYMTWVAGYRISVSGNDVQWVEGGTKDDYSYENFRKYLDIVDTYASTISLQRDLEKVSFDDVNIGDIFVKGGSPGHTVIIVDMAVNTVTGEKMLLIAEGNTPATQMYIVPNKSTNPWFAFKEGKELDINGWHCSQEDLRRFE